MKRRIRRNITRLMSFLLTLALCLSASFVLNPARKTVRAAQEYSVTIHSNIPGKDETQSGMVEDGKTIRFRGGYSVYLDSDDEETAAAGELMYFGYYLQYPGYAMTGWNTKADGSGTAYAFGTTFAMPSENVDLYAQWAPEVTITMHTNFDPATDFDRSHSLTPGGYIYYNYVEADGSTYEYVFDANDQRINWGTYGGGTLDTKGYSFDSFNTKADGSGTSYHLYDNIYPASDMDLYMIWTKNNTVTLHDNTSANQTGKISGIGSIYINTEYAMFNSGDAFYVSSFVNPGYKIAGWNTKADGSGTQYKLYENIDVTADMDLYAQWATSNKVTFHENITNEQTVSYDAVGDLVVYEGSAYDTVSGEMPWLPFENPGYSIIGWNTKADGSGIVYNFNDTVEVSSPMDLYAQWGKLVTLTVHGDVDGSGNEQMNTIEVPEGSCFKVSGGTYSCVNTYLPSDLQYITNQAGLWFNRSDAAFASWKDSAGNEYKPGDTLYGPITGNMDLYAQMTTDIVKVTFDFVDANKYGNPVTYTYAKGEKVQYEWRGVELFGYSEDLSKDEYYDTAQFEEGEVKADADKTFYAVFVTQENLYDPDSCFYYSILNNGSVMVSGYDGPLTDVRIPMTIDGKTVSTYYWWRTFKDPNNLDGTVTNNIESIVYFDYIPHCKYYGAGGTGILSAEYFPNLKSITFEGAAPQDTPWEFADLDIIGYYPESWTSVPSSTLGNAKHIEWKKNVPPAVESIEITSVPTKVEYTSGVDTALDVTGGKIKANYDNGTSVEVDITADMVSGLGLNTLGAQNLTVTYEGKTAQYSVTVIQDKTTPTVRQDHETKAPDKILVNGTEVTPNNYKVTVEDDTVIVELTDSFRSTLPEDAEITLVYGSENYEAQIEEKGLALVVLSVENGEQTLIEDEDGELEEKPEEVVIVISGDKELLKEVTVNGEEAEIGKDVIAEEGSTILTFSEEFLATLPKDQELEVVAVFENGVARTSITLNTVTVTPSPTPADGKQDDGKPTDNQQDRKTTPAPESKQGKAPANGDNNVPASYLALLGAGIAALYVIWKRRRGAEV